MDVLDAALAVAVLRVEARRAGLIVQRDRALLGVAAADDPRATLLVRREVPERGRLRVAVGLPGLLELPPGRMQLRPEESLEATTVAHGRGFVPGPQSIVASR